MHALNWCVDVVVKLMIGLPSWVVTRTFQQAYKNAKDQVRLALAPGRGGPGGDNDGIAYNWPDARVSTDKNYTA